jgi:hypothetical protein
MMSGNWPAFKCSIEGGNVVDGAFASCPGTKQLSPAVSRLEFHATVVAELFCWLRHQDQIFPTKE